MSIVPWNTGVFSLYILVCEAFTDSSFSSSLILPLDMTSLLINPSKAFFIFFYNIFWFQHFLLIRSISRLTLFIYSYKLPTFSISALHILVIVILNSLSRVGDIAQWYSTCPGLQNDNNNSSHHYYFCLKIIKYDISLVLMVALSFHTSFFISFQNAL